ncbi:hypothetical protein QBC43DRAFT_360383 [Cladorrhinum sp. PSN259]|nr:hypothetical protein QBC43DRAFT_360383 [Cladorrhinum sp. PSN259]
MASKQTGTSAKKQTAIIISGFACIGKSKFSGLKTYQGYEIVDLDSAGYTVDPKTKVKRDSKTFVEAYIKDILAYAYRPANKKVILMMSTHLEIRQEMCKRGLKYTLVYPQPGAECKGAWLTRLRERAGEDALYKFFADKWAFLIDGLENGFTTFESKAGATRVRLGKDDYLTANKQRPGAIVEIHRVARQSLQ